MRRLKLEFKKTSIEKLIVSAKIKQRWNSQTFQGKNLSWEWSVDKDNLQNLWVENLKILLAKHAFVWLLLQWITPQSLFLKKDKTKTVSCSAAKGLKLKSGFVKERFAQKKKRNSNYL
jgi:hypothetical protein